MKKGKLFSTFALTFLAIGVGASLIGTHDVVRADAAENEPAVTETRDIYVDLTYGAQWFNDDAKVYAFVMQDDGKTYNAWVELSKAPNEEEVEKFTLPALPEGATGWNKTTIVRFDPNNFTVPSFEHHINNQTVDTDIPVAPKDCIKILDAKEGDKSKVELIKYVPTAERGLTSGSKVYFDIKLRDRKPHDTYTYWNEADAKLAILAKSAKGEAFTKFMVPATGAYEGINNLYEAVLPQINNEDVLFNTLIIGRYAPETEESKLTLDEGKYWAKSMDIAINSSEDNVLITYNSKKDTNHYWAGTETTGDYDAANTFAKNFKIALNGVCKADGTTGAAELTKAINDQKAAFEKLSARAQEIVKHNDRGNKGDVQNALTLYDYIVSKYRDNNVVNDFMGRRAPEQSSSPLTMTEDFTTLIIVATIVAAAAITAITVISIRRRKLVK